MKRIFLVGCPRSGTTLLQGILGCSPQVAAFTESHLFGNCISLYYPVPIVVRSLRQQADRFLAENSLPASALPASLSARGRWTAKGAARAIFDILDAAASARGKTVLLEKTPRNLHFIPLMEKAIPDLYATTRFVHLLRDGVPVAASLTEASGTWRNANWNPESSLERWQSDIRRSSRYLHHPGHVFVTYESLVAQPERVALALAETLGLSLTPADLERRGAVLASVVRPDERWKHETMNRPIQPQNRSASHIGQQVLHRLEDRIDRTTFALLSAHAIAAA